MNDRGQRRSSTTKLQSVAMFVCIMQARVLWGTLEWNPPFTRSPKASMLTTTFTIQPILYMNVVKKQLHFHPESARFDQTCKQTVPWRTGFDKFSSTYWIPSDARKLNLEVQRCIGLVCQHVTLALLFQPSCVASGPKLFAQFPWSDWLFLSTKCSR